MRYLILFALLLAACTKQVPVTDEPKQSPYVIIFQVCERTEYVLVTTDPPLGVNAHQKASKKMLAALQSVPQERVLILKHWDPSCVKSEKT